VPLVVFVGIWSLTTHGKFSVTGDEPHYLLMSESLRSDGDLDLTDEYADGSSGRIGHPGLAVDGHARPDRSGQLRSIHEPGLPILLMPVYAMAQNAAQAVSQDTLRRFRMSPGLFAYALVSLFQLALTCLGLSFVLDTAKRLSSPGIGAATTLTAGLAPPVLSTGFLVFPEVPAFTVVAFLLWTCWGAGRWRAWASLAAAAALGMLPWMHRKFTLLAAGLLLCMLWQRTKGQSWTRRRTLELAVFALPMLAFYLTSVVWWGTLSGPTALDGWPFSWHAAESGLPGLLFDRENGLFVWAPIYLPMGAAWWLTRRWSWPLIVPCMALYVPSASHDLWWGGFSPAGRFLMPIVPCLACVLAASLERIFLRRFAIGLVALQCVISAIAWQWPRALWPRGDGHNRLLESLPLFGMTAEGILPSFRAGSAGFVVGALWMCAFACLSALLVVMCRTQQTNDGPTGQKTATESSEV
jgi:hypothetical protein